MGADSGKMRKMIQVLLLLRKITLLAVWRMDKVSGTAWERREWPENNNKDEKRE